MHTRSFFLYLLLTIALSLPGPVWSLAEERPPRLAIEIHEKGTALIQASIELQTPPDQAFMILTDYEQWPTLFPEGFHIHLTDCQEDCSVVADMIIPHVLVSWTTHLRVTSHESPPHMFELHLLDGDYLQYQLRWDFAPTQNSENTLATMSLTLQPKGSLTDWTPNFFYEWTLRNGLENHFKRIQQQVALRSGKSFSSK
ncbi:MAG: hypothetical protein NPIRA05_23000 [Nitrospirales bacterium]|nr:MAG: hypothetical protein NPIRA05_23000 [Nitrospirales bacterium]